MLQELDMNSKYALCGDHTEYIEDTDRAEGED